MKRIILWTIYLSMMMFPVSASGTLPLKGDVDNSGNINLQDATPTVTTTIDVHAHATISDSSASAQQLLDLMTANTISKVIMMQTPMPCYHDTNNSSDSSESLMNFFLSLGSSFRYMYGGAELQPLLYATGHTGEITLAELYPNGGADMSQADIDKLNAIAADPTTYKTIFRARATAAAQSGKYVGFGELAPLHYSLKSGQPYMIYKVDTPWMLWLSDLAAQYNMVLDIHFEATSTTLAEFATLLAYNSATKIIWDHAGWSNSGLATAAVFSQMLADHPNLYLNLKMRSGSNLAAGSPTDNNGNLKSEWSTLLTTYADRIMVGTDAKYWNNPGKTIEEELANSYTLLDNMLKLLPTDTAQKIRNGTAKTLFDPVVCSFSLSPTNYGFSPSSGMVSMTVTASSSTCSWTATSNDSWITIASGSSGTGSGTVTYNVAANTTGSARKGTITVAGQTITIRQAGSTFWDVPENVFKPYIYSIYAEGITVGFGSGMYCPSNNVTRGQMAAFIIRSKFVGETFSYTTTPYYSDVPSTHTFFKYVQKLKDEGITTTTGTYMVDDIVTREQMAAFIIRAKYGETFSHTTVPYYSDVASTSVFYKYVQKLKDDAITTTTGTYMASSNVTRDQMAAFLGRAFLGME